MSKTIEITDMAGRGYLSFDLRELLGGMEDIGPSLSWFVRHIEARGDIADVWPKGMLDLESAAGAAPAGVRFDWKDLVRLSRGLEQTTNCKITGTRNSPDALSVEIQAIDSGCWRISSTDEQLIDRVARRFAQVRVVS